MALLWDVRSRWRDRRDAEVTQARSVVCGKTVWDSKPETGWLNGVNVMVTNYSPAPILNLGVEIARIYHPGETWPEDHEPIRLYFAVLPPGATVQELVRFPVPAPWSHADIDPTYRAVVDMTFTDAAGREWRRQDMHQPERTYSTVQRLQFRLGSVIAGWHFRRAIRRSTRDAPPSV